MQRTAGWTYPSSGSIHAGVDFGVDIGTPVFAVRDGTILKVVDNIPNLRPDQDGESGDPPNFILQEITYKNEPATVVYLHLSPRIRLKEGDPVTAGQRIAKSGHNGHSLGPHLHVSVMKGRHFSPFDYLHDLTDASPRPTGLATNGITIYPPRLVYRPAAPDELAKGRIVVADLKFGTMDSDSVRRLQHRLNGIPLVGGATLPETGNYLDQTRAEVTKWQVQKQGAEPGSDDASGNLTRKQIKAMFGKRFKLVG